MAMAQRLLLVALLAITTASLMPYASGQFTSLTKSIAKDATKSGPVLPKKPSKRWGPKTDDSYDPKTVDWAGVVSACRAVVEFEKRLGNFWIRASFHDALSVDMAACIAGGAAADIACGGADSSNMLSIEEMTRPENAYDQFTQIAARASIKLAAWFNCSMADTVAVCAAVSIETHSSDRLKIIGPDGYPNLPVGRLDSLKPTPAGLLPAKDVSLAEFSAFWKERGFTNAQGVALLGSHSLLDEQDCDMGPNRPRCNPSAVHSCQNVRMFRWDNHYYQFTSEKFRKISGGAADAARAGKVPVDPAPTLDVNWYRGCTNFKYPNTCPVTKWFYTINDAFLGQACQSVYGYPSDDIDEIATAIKTYAVDITAWDEVIKPTYIQMVSTFARWSAASKGFLISGKECVSGWKADAKCASGLKVDAKTISCTNCGLTGSGCHVCCMCGTVFKGGVSVKGKG